MSIVSDIHNIYEFAKDTADKDFFDFARGLNNFVAHRGKDVNLNDCEVFGRFVEEEIFKNEYIPKISKDSVVYLLESFREKGFVDYENFHKAFQKIKKEYSLGLDLSKTLPEDLALKNDLKSTLQSELIANANLSFVKNLQKPLQGQKTKKIDESLQNLSQDFSQKSFLQQYPKETLQDLEQDSPHKSPTLQSPTPRELFAYINDKESIHFPFKKSQTLDSRDFMRALDAELGALSSQEIEAMVKKMRAKNEALRNEIAQIQTNHSAQAHSTQTHSAQTLKQEIGANIDLSENILKLEAASRQENLHENLRENLQKNEREKRQIPAWVFAKNAAKAATKSKVAKDDETSEIDESGAPSESSRAAEFSEKARNVMKRKMQ